MEWDQLWTVDEVARAFNRSRPGVWNASHRGRIEKVTHGRAVRLVPDSVCEYYGVSIAEGSVLIAKARKESEESDGTED